MEKDDHEERVRALEERTIAFEAREKGKRNSKIIGWAGSVGGAATGAAIGYHLLGDTLYKMGEGVAEAWDGVLTAKRLIDMGNYGGDTPQLEGVNPAIRAEYIKSVNGGISPKIFEAGQVVLNAGGRASENFPGANAETVQEVRRIKGKIFEAGRGLLFGKEESETTNTLQYTNHYNELSSFEDSAIAKLHALDLKIADYSEQNSLEKAQTGKVSAKNNETLESMVVARNEINNLREEMKDLPIEQIYAGMNDTGYETLIQTAHEQEIYRPDYSGAGNAALIGGVLVASLVGAKVGKYVGRGAQLAYGAGAVANKGRKNIQEKIKGSRKN